MSKFPILLTNTLLTSITKNIKSIILAPDIIVFIKLACPGQSTKVY